MALFVRSWNNEFAATLEPARAPEGNATSGTQIDPARAAELR
jgi:hypothetical protein